MIQMQWIRQWQWKPSAGATVFLFHFAFDKATESFTVCVPQTELLGSYFNFLSGTWSNMPLPGLPLASFSEGLLQIRLNWRQNQSHKTTAVWTVMWKNKIHSVPMNAYNNLNYLMLWKLESAKLFKKLKLWYYNINCFGFLLMAYACLASLKSMTLILK